MNDSDAEPAERTPTEPEAPKPDGPKEIEEAAQQESEYPEDQTNEG